MMMNEVGTSLEHRIAMHDGVSISEHAENVKTGVGRKLANRKFTMHR